MSERSDTNNIDTPFDNNTANVGAGGVNGDGNTNIIVDINEELLVQERNDEIKKYIINNSKICLKEWHCFIGTINHIEFVDKLTDNQVVYHYNIMQKVFQGHKSVSGRNLENILEKYLKEYNIKYISQVAITKTGRYAINNFIKSSMKKKSVKNIVKKGVFL